MGVTSGRRPSHPQIPKLVLASKRKLRMSVRSHDATVRNGLPGERAFHADLEVFLA